MVHARTHFSLLSHDSHPPTPLISKVRGRSCFEVHFCLICNWISLRSLSGCGPFAKLGRARPYSRPQSKGVVPFVVKPPYVSLGIPCMFPLESYRRFFSRYTLSLSSGAMMPHSLVAGRKKYASNPCRTVPM